VTVGHSLGGLVLAQVIYGGDKASPGNNIRSVSDKVVGMLFLGTPFYGSPTATWGESFRRVLDLVRRESDRNTLGNLKPDSQTLKPLRDGFPEAIQKRGLSEAKIGVSYCFEKLKTYGVVRTLGIKGMWIQLMVLARGTGRKCQISWRWREANSDAY
jgi:hypothetical protein